MIRITWSIPIKLEQDPTLTKIHIYRGTDETNIDSYQSIAVIDRWELISESPQVFNYEKEILGYTDTTGRKSFYYFVKYGTSLLPTSKIISTCFEFSPREMRLLDSFRSAIDPIVASVIEKDGTFRELTDEELYSTLNISASVLNSMFPNTSFSLSGVTSMTEGILFLNGLKYFLLVKGLGLSLRDFSYSDNGLSLTQSLGDAAQKTYDNLSTMIDKVLETAQLSLSVPKDMTKFSIGTLPISINKVGTSRGGKSAGMELGGPSFIDLWGTIRN